MASLYSRNSGMPVGKHHGFVVVDEAEACAYEVVLHYLELKAAHNGEAEVHFLEVLLCDVEGFLFVLRGCAEFVVDGIDGVLEIVAFLETQERNGRLQEYGQQISKTHQEDRTRRFYESRTAADG